MNAQLDIQKAAQYFRANGMAWLADALARGDQMAAAFCQFYAGQVAANGGNPMVFARELPPGGHDGCACGGKGNCPGGQCQIPAGLFGGQQQPPPQIPMMPGAPPLQVLPQCYTDCDCIDACLYEFLKAA